MDGQDELLAAIRTDREAWDDQPEQVEQTEQPEERAATEQPEEQPEQPEEQTEEAESTDAPADEVEEIELSSFADLMEHVGADESDAYNLTVPVSINGKTEQVRLGDLKDSYHATAEAKRFQESAKHEREQAEEKARELVAQHEQSLAEAAAFVQSLESQALERFQGIDWNALRTEDPSEWSAKRMELETAQRNIQDVKQRVAQQMQGYKAKIDEQRSAAMQEHIAKEREALMKAWPELADTSKGKDEESALIDELRHRNFTDQEISSASDHRLLLMARDAMRYRQQAEKTNAAKKKVVRIQQKVLKPGAARDKAERGQDVTRQAAQALKKSGKHQDFAAWLGAVRRSS